MGPTASIFLKETLSEVVAIQLDGVLRSISSNINSTRKGRDWNLWLANAHEKELRPFHVHIWDTQKYLGQCDNTIDELDLDPATVPACIALSAEANQPEDWKILEHLVQEVTVKMNGISTRLEK